MATVQSIETEVKALADDLKAEAVDETEALLFITVAVSAMQREYAAAQQAADEEKAGLVLQARSVGAKSVDEQKEDLAVQMKKRAEDVTAVEAITSLKLKD